MKGGKRGILLRTRTSVFNDGDRVNSGREAKAYIRVTGSGWALRRRSHSQSQIFVLFEINPVYVYDNHPSLRMGIFKGVETSGLPGVLIHAAEYSLTESGFKAESIDFNPLKDQLWDMNL